MSRMHVDVYLIMSLKKAKKKKKKVSVNSVISECHAPFCTIPFFDSAQSRL